MTWGLSCWPDGTANDSLKLWPRRCDRQLPQYSPVASRITAILWEDAIEVFGTQVTRDHFPEYVSEVGGDGQVAALVELLIR